MTATVLKAAAIIYVPHKSRMDMGNRFKIGYDIPKFPVKPAFSFETFYQLNNPDGNTSIRCGIPFL
jgi:hypothetical protein